LLDVSGLTVQLCLTYDPPVTLFSDELLAAIGAWQNGWHENQERRESLAADLVATVADLPKEFRTVNGECYRKRFLHQGELVDILLKDEKHEGVVSWTLDEKVAEHFKGLVRPDSFAAAIFAHRPTQDEVIVNLAALWARASFAHAVDKRDGPYAKALANFNSRQGEVVLRAPLRGSEIKSLVGISSSFDELFDQVGLPEEGRDELIRQMLRAGEKVGVPRYTGPGGAQRAVDRAIDALYRKLERLKAENDRKVE
jgi:hypothetical protein